MIESQILKENRNFAELEVNKQKRYDEILECLGDRELTAKEMLMRCVGEDSYQQTKETLLRQD